MSLKGDRQACLAALVVTIAAYLALTLGARSHASAVPALVDDYRQIIASRGRIPDTVRLEQLTSLYLNDTPTVSVVEGKPARWMSRTAEVATARQQMPLALAAVNSIDEAKLPPAAKLDRRFLLYAVTAESRQARFPIEYLKASPRTGLYGVPPPSLPHATTADYEIILAWLRGVPLRMAESMDLMHQGLARGIVGRSQILEATLAFSRNLVAADPLSTAYLSAFKNLASSSVPPGQQKALIDQAVEIYRRGIAPAHADWITFVEKTYLPAARKFSGMASLPDGAAWYGEDLRALTGLNLSPDDIHRQALAEVRRRRSELEATARSVDFSGSYADFVRALPRAAVCAPAVLDANGIRAQFHALMRQVEQGLPKLFAVIPKTPYEIDPVPSSAPSHLSRAGVQAGSLAEGRAARIPLGAPWEGGACSFVTLMLHEALPGHVLQSHIASERGEVSELRRQFPQQAFTEGWATYAQGLAEELGLDSNGYTRAAVTSALMFMAARAVVDTGIHAKSWTRDHAIDYYRTTIGWDHENAAPVIDRVVNAPASYLAYFVGREEIVLLRARAERELGQRFDIRLFHDEILRNGPLPFDVLNAQISDWIASRR